MSAVTRRQALAAALALPLAASAREAERPPVIIDTHQHLWDLKRFKLPWVAKGSPLARDFTPADYAAEVKGTGIEHAVYLEVDVAPEQQQAEAEWVAKLCAGRRTHTRAAVVS